VFAIDGCLTFCVQAFDHEPSGTHLGLGPFSDVRDLRESDEVLALIPDLRVSVVDLPTDQADPGEYA
jgi:hypothetical protein